MIKATNPRVLLGLPVYNGENYLRQALDSILAQTLTDFKVLISDNASTDTTSEICREYAAKDDRIIYYRQPENIGAAPNFNFVFQPDGFPYFKWVAHDDVLESDYLLRCIELLDRDPSLVIAHCPSFKIDENGVKVGNYDRQLRLNGQRARDRFWRILWVVHFTEVFGVMRSDAIAQTNLHGSYVGSDRHFMSEMLLLGDIGYTEERLFQRRHHPTSFCNALASDSDRLKWFDPKAKKMPRFVGIKKFKQYVSSIFEMKIPANERIACLELLIEWAIRRGFEFIIGDNDQYRRKLMKQQASFESITYSERPSSGQI